MTPFIKNRKRISREKKGALLTLGGGIGWGLSGSVGQFLFTEEGMNAYWLVPVKLGWAGIILLAYCFYKYGAEALKPWRSRKDVRDMIVYGLLGVSLCQFFYLLTIQLSSAATATILQNLSPVFILIYVCCVSSRKPTRREIIAIILALAGVFLLATHGHIGQRVIRTRALVSGICAALCVMIYNCLPQRLLKKYPVTLLQGWAFLTGGVIFSVLFKIWEVDYAPSLTGVLGICFTVLIGNVASFTAYMYGVTLIGPAKSILYAFGEPVTAAFVSALWLKTPFTFADGIGFLLIFGMLVLISHRTR